RVVAMESTPSAAAAADGTSDAAAAVPCPRCGESLPSLPPLVAAALGGAAVRRCRRCGTRSTTDDPKRFVFSCEPCGIPFLSPELLPHGDHACPTCRDGQLPADLPDAVVIRATEREVRAALAQRWRFVAKPQVNEYLERVTRQIARRVDGAPGASRVYLIE